MFASTAEWSVTLTIVGGVLQVGGVVLAWLALRATKRLLNDRVASRASQSPVVPPGPRPRASPNLPSDIPASLRPRDSVSDVRIVEDQIRRLDSELTAAEQRSWGDTQSLERFTAGLTSPSREAFWSGVAIITGVVLATIGALLGLT
jgi:hypothetical protein